MNYFVAIVNSTSGNLFSGIKVSTPKMINALKEQCKKNEELFKEQFKVVRFISTPKGYKKI
jgi:hypothetical protein